MSYMLQKQCEIKSAGNRVSPVAHHQPSKNVAGLQSVITKIKTRGGDPITVDLLRERLDELVPMRGNYQRPASILEKHWPAMVLTDFPGDRR